MNGYTPPIPVTEQARNVAERLRAVCGKEEAAAITREILGFYGVVCPEFVRELDYQTRQLEAKK